MVSLYQCSSTKFRKVVTDWIENSFTAEKFRLSPITFKLISSAMRLLAFSVTKVSWKKFERLEDFEKISKNKNSRRESFARRKKNIRDTEFSWSFLRRNNFVRGNFSIFVRQNLSPIREKILSSKPSTSSSLGSWKFGEAETDKKFESLRINLLKFHNFCAVGSTIFARSFASEKYRGWNFRWIINSRHRKFTNHEQ